MIRLLLLVLTFSSLATYLHARTLLVGTEGEFSTIESAAAAAQPGDSILVSAGVWGGGNFLIDLQGRADAWIHLIGEDTDEAVIIRGGSEALHITDPAFLYIAGFTFEQQTANGVNIDDGGTYATPAHDVLIEDCKFGNIDAIGNNDLLKLSGLNNFTIRNCEFFEGAAGGSGIDMVGCHEGIIEDNTFLFLGASGIQAKGGTQFISIRRNTFFRAGARALNLGGSTGLQFFRPLNAPFEAADLFVYSNVFIEGEAAVAFVGSVRVHVVNNSFYHPQKWVARILQETVDPDRFLSCGDNVFRNNLVEVNAQLSRPFNVGPDTRPESFTIDHNLWYDANAPWSYDRDFPVPQIGSIYDQNPMIQSPLDGDFTLLPGSPAIGRGLPVELPELDFQGRQFGLPRSIGAMEFDDAVATNVAEMDAVQALQLFPNPAHARLTITLPHKVAVDAKVELTVTTLDGKSQTLDYRLLDNITLETTTHNLPQGVYLLQLAVGNFHTAELFFKND